MACLSAFSAWAGTPDWLQTASRESIPTYPGNPSAVMLLHEDVVTVKNTSEVATMYRRAYRILRPEGRRYGTVHIYFDSETRVTFLKAWSIPSSGGGYEVKEKDAIDTIPFSESLYEDTRQKVLRIPASDPGSVIGFEYEQRGRPAILQDDWIFQGEVPVRLARIQLKLPAGWEFKEFWANHAPAPFLSIGGNQFMAELRDIPAIHDERDMPAWRAITGQLHLAFIPADARGYLKSWAQVAEWFEQLASDRLRSSGELRQKVSELTVGATTPLDKIRSLASFVQRQVRYVAIEIGIGGYQPHPAELTFKNRYGDCKDKATLLRAMLNEIGINSHYVLINSSRGVVIPEFPSSRSFNHAIVAIQVPSEPLFETFPGGMLHKKLGTLLFFDPTDPYVPLGYLPSHLQANYGLLVGDGGGELIKLPLTPPGTNRSSRTAKLQLGSDGSLEGSVEERRTGAAASDFRAAWLNMSDSERNERVHAHVGRQLTNVELNSVSVQDLDKPDRDPVLRYRFRLGTYTTAAGSLLLFRPRIFAQWADDLMENGDRRQPVQFAATILRSESVEIALPEGVVVDELPASLQADIGAIAYTSGLQADGRLLRYSRQMEIRDFLVSSEQIPKLKQFYQQVAADEKTRVILKRP